MAKRNKRKIVESGIAAQDSYYAEQLRQEELEKARKNNDPARPNLLKRFGSILLDALMIGIVIAGLYAVAYYTVFPSVGYQSCLEEARQTRIDSGLYFITEEGRFESVTDHYDESITPSENYDTRITNYYTLDERCVRDNKLYYYNNAKNSSGLFVMEDGAWKESPTATRDSIKSFYVAHYDDAVKFLERSPVIITASNKTLLISTFTMMVCSIVATIPFYLIIPLCRKEGETLGQMIFKLALVNESDRGAPTNKQKVIRYMAVLVIIYLFPIALNIKWTWAFGLPIFISAGMIAIKKNNGAFQDLLSKTVVINKSRSDAMEVLKAIKG